MKFSIIIPSFQQGIYLQDTIDSLSSQNADTELLLMDGGSTDSTIDVIKANQSKLDYWVSESDRGQSHAINKGFEKCTGDIITWVNSDDQLAEGALTKVEALFKENPHVDVIHGDTYLFGPGITEGTKGAPNRDLQSQYLGKMAFPQPSSFIRRSALKGWNELVQEGLHFGMDYDLFVRIHLQGSKFMRVNDVLSRSLLHDECKSMTSDRKFAEDWLNIFKGVSASVGKKDLFETMCQRTGLKPSENYTYSSSLDVSDSVYQKATSYFLAGQVSFRYNAHDYDDVKKILQYLKNADREVFDYFNLSKTLLRTQIPGWLWFKKIAGKA
jgi:glycosyltransferase involved in cell wall biosynthesis